MIAELLEGSGPVFDRMIQVLEAADTVKQSIKGKVADDMQQAAERIDESLGLVFEGFDSLTGSLLDEAEKINRRKARAKRPGSFAPGLPAEVPAAARAACSVTASTPISNRGVRLPKHATRTVATNSIGTKTIFDKPSTKIRGGKK
jgi:hypothetical protein